MKEKIAKIIKIHELKIKTGDFIQCIEKKSRNLKNYIRLSQI
jgi:hypothetical protein